MSEKGIVAAWMSPARLFEFTMCNQLMNVVFLLFKYLLVVLNAKRIGDEHFLISDTAYLQFTYIFRGYGVIIAILGITLIILSRIGKVGGIDGKRTMHLLILGIVNIIETIYFLMEVAL